MPRQVAIRILLACAFLFAQQAALAHDFWHAQQKSTTAQGAPKGQKLCELHDLLGTVLGVASAAAVSHDPVAVHETGFHSVAALRADDRPLAAHSRGPPTIS